MSIAEINGRFEINVTAYNEGETQREYGGMVTKTKTDSVTLSILYMHIQNSKMVRKQNGQRFIEDGFTFQVSSAEELKKNFTVIAGRTIIVKDGENYKVTVVKDYTMYPLTQAKECLAIRMIPIDV